MRPGLVVDVDVDAAQTKHFLTLLDLHTYNHQSINSSFDYTAGQDICVYVCV